MTDARIITQWYKIAEHHHSAFFGAFELYRIAIKGRGSFRSGSHNRHHGGYIWYVVYGNKSIYNGKPYKNPVASIVRYGPGFILSRDSFQEAKDAFDEMINQTDLHGNYVNYIRKTTLQPQPFIPKKDPEVDIMIEIMCVGIAKAFQ